MAYHIQYQQLTEENLLKKADGQLVRMKSDSIGETVPS